MDDAVLLERMWASLAHFQGLMGRHAPGGRVIEREGYVASVIGAVPRASLPNAVVPLDPNAVLADLELLGRAYAEAGVSKWAVWINGGLDETTAALADAGLVLDSVPAAMGAPLADLELQPGEGRPSDGPTVGAVNDLAYGYGENGPLSTVLSGLPAHAAHVTCIEVAGEPASAMLAGDCGEDTPIWFVATVPEARGRGLASRLMSAALTAARERGQTSTTLQASQKGQAVYARLGYRSLGRLELWEMRR